VHSEKAAATGSRSNVGVEGCKFLEKHLEELQKSSGTHPNEGKDGWTKFKFSDGGLGTPRWAIGGTYLKVG